MLPFIPVGLGVTKTEHAPFDGNAGHEPVDEDNNAARRLVLEDWQRRLIDYASDGNSAKVRAILDQHGAALKQNILHADMVLALVASNATVYAMVPENRISARREVYPMVPEDRILEDLSLMPVELAVLEMLVAEFGSGRVKRVMHELLEESPVQTKIDEFLWGAARSDAKEAEMYLLDAIDILVAVEQIDDLVEYVLESTDLSPSQKATVTTTLFNSDHLRRRIGAASVQGYLDTAKKQKVHPSHIASLSSWLQLAKKYKKNKK